MQGNNNTTITTTFDIFAAENKVSKNRARGVGGRYNHELSRLSLPREWKGRKVNIFQGMDSNKVVVGVKISADKNDSTARAVNKREGYVTLDLSGKLNAAADFTLVKETKDTLIYEYAQSQPHPQNKSQAV